jgi:hypothetical protein
MFVRSTRFISLWLLAGALLVAGCSSKKYSADESALAPSGPAGELVGALPDDGTLDARLGRRFFPLAVGNRWEYHEHSSSQITTSEGTQPPFIEDRLLVDEIVRTEQIGERTYFIESESSSSGGSPTLGSEFLVRESRFGLFELDQPHAQVGAGEASATVTQAPPALAAYIERSVPDAGARVAFDRAAAQVTQKLEAIRMSLHALRPPRGVDPNEITLLSFPLSLGARWIVRDDPRFERTVVGRERVSVPLGRFVSWKLRGTSELFGPGDRLHLWYANVGLVRIRVHVTGDAVDQTGNVIGRVVTDVDESLTGLTLQRPGMVADAPLP